MDSQNYSYELDGLAIKASEPQPLGYFKMRSAGQIIDLLTLREVAIGIIRSSPIIGLETSSVTSLL